MTDDTPLTSRKSPEYQARTSGPLKKRLLAGTAALALMAGTLSTLALHAETRDPFANPSRPAAQASVSMPDFTPIVDAVKPAVVSVRVKSEAGAQVSGGGAATPFEGTPFERFFRQYGEQGGSGGAPRQFQQALGSGFFISPDGYIVTNNHVVDHAVNVQVVMDDGTELEAKVIGTDKRTDIALLKVDGRSDLPFVNLAAGSPRIGSWVLAVGNPFGLGGTVTAGIVSAKGRDIGNGPYDDYIQIDAPVNRGNSGGPTFDMNGAVVGVNTAIYSPSGGSVGIAFDIPADTVRTVVGQLRERGHVERGWLGVSIQPVSKDIADSLGVAPQGALVTEAQPGSPALRAGLKSGDIVEKVDGREVKDSRDLARVVGGFAPSTEVTLSVWRDGKTQDVKVTLGQFEDRADRRTEAAPSRQPADITGKLGLRLAPANSVEGAGEQGLVVIGVDPGGTAAEAGISTGDVILRAGGVPAKSARDVTEALAKARHDGKKHTLALVRHDNTENYVALPTG